MADEQLYDEQKFRELLLYVASKSVGDRSFGRVKLNKILFYADFIAYTQLGHSITGAEYQKLENGPAPRKMLPVLSQLKEERLLAEAIETGGGWERKTPVALRAPDISAFSPEEISIVDSVMNLMSNMSATAASELSHQFAGWKLAEMRETIPYSAALIPEEPEPASEATLRRGREIAARYRASRIA